MEVLDGDAVGLVIGAAIAGVVALLRVAYPAQVPLWCRRHRNLIAVVVPLLMVGAGTWAATGRFAASWTTSAISVAAAAAVSVLGRYLPVRSARARRRLPAMEPEHLGRGTTEHLRRTL